MATFVDTNVLVYARDASESEKQARAAAWLELAERAMQNGLEQQAKGAVAQALRGDFLTTGPTVDAFEAAFREVVGAKHAVACANGTAALHLALLATGIGAGDEVVTTPLTFFQDRLIWMRAMKCYTWMKCSIST